MNVSSSLRLTNATDIHNQDITQIIWIECACHPWISLADDRLDSWSLRLGERAATHMLAAACRSRIPDESTLA